jgi:hypothetical protein
MGADKIAAFYDDDPVQEGLRAWSSAKAYSFRSVSIDDGLCWRAFSGVAGRRPFAAGARPVHPGAEISCSILVIIVVAVVVGLIGRVMRHVALIVPQLSIHAIGGEQLGMRAALDRLAA